MAGWDLNEGLCSNQNPSDQEFWGALEHLYKNTHKTATYKFCLLKCLLDYMPDGFELKLTFDNLFYRFTEIYWDLIVKYELCQIYTNSQYQRSKIEVIIGQVIENNDLYKKGTLKELPVKIRKDMINEIAQYCSNNVIGALFESTYGLFYSFSKKEKALVLTQSSRSFLQRYKRLIEEINYFHWAKMIEKVNGHKTPLLLITKISKLGNSTSYK